MPLGSICRFAKYVDPDPYIHNKGSVHEFPSGVNIGIVWSGSPSHVNDRHRSCPVGNFKFLSEYGNLWSLNPGATNVPKWVNRLPIATWQDTISVLSGLDFVVSVDTSLVHMAGAL